MNVAKIPTGHEPPSDINVVIEIPQGSGVKYEVDKNSGALIVDRFLFTPMAYPAAYGFIPGTLADDGDPADALVLVPAPGPRRRRARSPRRRSADGGRGRSRREDHLRPARPGASAIQHVENIEDLPEITRAAIEHFFERYKDLEKDKWVKVTGWGDRSAAENAIRRATWKISVLTTPKAAAE